MATTSAAVVNGLRGIWLGVSDFGRARSFYELLGAEFGTYDASGEILVATLGDARLIFEAGPGNPPRTGPYLLFDVADADALHAKLVKSGFAIEQPPKNEPWGRQFNVLDPNGYSIAFVGPTR